MRNANKEYSYWIPRTDTLYKREVVQCSACHHTQLDPTATCEHCHASMMRCAENAQGTCKSYPHCDGCGAKLPAVAETGVWVIPVTWEMCGTIAIPKTKAPCLEDAIRLCNEDSDELGLPSGEYVDGSFAATDMERSYIRDFYNNGVHDAKSEGFYEFNDGGTNVYLHIQEGDTGWKYAIYSQETLELQYDGTIFEYELDEVIPESILKSVMTQLLKNLGIAKDGVTFRIKNADRDILAKLQGAR